MGRRKQRSNPRDTPDEPAARTPAHVPAQQKVTEEEVAALRAQARELQRIQALQVTTWSGQFPHPDDIRVYEEFCPGFLQQLMQERSLQITHRHKLETVVTTSSVANSQRGQWLGFVLALAAIVLSGVVALHGQPLVGVGGAIGSIAILAGVFVYGNERRVDELRSKWRAVTGGQDANQPPGQQNPGG